MKCYSHYHADNRSCRSCSYRRWCQTAADLPLLSAATADDELQRYLASPPGNPEKAAPEKLCYTRSDLLEVIHFLLALDYQTLEMLDQKIADPNITFAGLARQRRLSRQAIHKFILQRCRKIPELSEVLLNHSSKTAKPNLSFMEAVCKIRKQMSAVRSKKPKNTLKYSRKLSCSIRNFDLSKMSTIKGGSIWQQG